MGNVRLLIFIKNSYCQDHAVFKLKKIINGLANRKHEMIANFCRNVDRFYSSFGELNYAAIGQNLSTKTSLCNYTTSFKNELDFVKYKHLYDHSIGDDKKSLKKKNKEKKIGAYTPVPRSRRNFIWK